MRRCDFILASGAIVVWALAARAQQPAMPVIGFLRSTSAAGSTALVEALRRGLAEAGYIEQRNVATKYRWADDRGERLPNLATDVIRRQCATI
jgi:putative ABC transport system substrate-binding protein